MFVLSEFISALAQVIGLILWLYSWLIVVRALISWVNPDPLNPIVEFLRRATDPMLEPIRRLLPPMPIDISPIIAYFVIVFLRSFLVGTLLQLSMRLH